VIRHWSTRVIAIAALLAACSRPVTPSVSPVPGTTATTGRTDPPVTASLDPTAGWQRIDLRADRPINPLVDVVAQDGVFYAAGSAGDPPVAPLVIRSGDGNAWTPEPISSAFASPSSLRAVGGRLLALGAGGTSKCAHPFAVDTWARALDGHWSEAPWVDGFCAGLERADLLDRHGIAALVGVGTGDQPMSWSSTDGLAWRDLRPRLADDFIRAAVVDGDAVLAFVAGPDGRPEARTSVDGRTFAQAPFPMLPAEASVLAALWRGPELDVFLGDGESLGMARRDAAGAWTTSPAVGVRADQASRIMEVGGRLVALGSDDNGRPLAWSSADGLTWNAVALPMGGPGTAVVAMAEIGNVVVLAGAADTPDGSRTIGAIWVGSAQLLSG
jgi:hypothetical protein